MKRMKYVTLSLCLGMSYGGYAQTAQVQIAGINYPVIFADTNLSNIVKQRIASDLTAVFSPASSFREARGGETDEVEPGVFKPRRSNLNLPQGKKREGIFLVDSNNEKSVRIDKVASSNYVHAFKLMAAHSNAVKKVQEFYVTLKNTDWSTQPIQALKNLHHMTPEDREEFDDDGYRGFAEEMQDNLTFRGITALGFSLQKRPEVGGREVLVYGDLLIFYDGRWGFGRFPYR